MTRNTRSNIAQFPSATPIQKGKGQPKLSNGNLALDTDFFPDDEQDPLITCDYGDYKTPNRIDMRVFEAQSDTQKDRRFSLKNIDILDVVILVGIFALGLAL